MRYIIYIFLAIATLNSCEIDPNRKKKDRKKLIEELTMLQTDSLRKELDSLCIITKEVEFEGLVDSVLDSKLKEIKEKIKQYQE